MPDCELTLKSKFKARVDTSSTVGPITYAESGLDKNLGAVQKGKLRFHYNENSACTYEGVINASTFTSIENAMCYDYPTLVQEGTHLTVNIAMLYIRVLSGIGSSSYLEVRVGSSTRMKPLQIGEAVTIPFNGAPINVAAYVRDPNYEEGTDELTVHMALAAIDLTADTYPPLPTPATFYTPPYALDDSSIQMIATVGSDSSPPIEYKFTETSGNPGGSNSSWGTSNSFYDGGLDPATTYTYTVQMRDALGNTGVVSSGHNATTFAGPDLDPPTPDPPTWGGVPTASSHTTIGMWATVPSDAQSPPVQTYFEETSGNTGGSDSGWNTNYSYQDTGLSASTQYSYRVKHRDSVGNETGWSSVESATTQAGPDVTPPNPNPPTWSVAPNVATNDEDNEVYMYAVQTTDTATGGSNPVEYFFEETSGNQGGADSGWIGVYWYNNLNLMPNTTYSYRHKTRDSAGNETSWSTTESITTWGPDITPPNPNPATFAVDPAVVSPHGESGVTMTATVAVDPSPNDEMGTPSHPVEYYFTEVTGNAGGVDSGWQASEVYTNTGLTPGTLYSYTVQTRDSIGNTGTASGTKSVNTLAADSSAPNPNPSTWDVVPTATSQSEITMTATVTTDPETPPVEYYFTNVSGGGSTSGWQLSPTYTDTGLTPGTTYSYRVHTRNSAVTIKYTGTSSTLSATTDSADTNAPTPDPPTWQSGYHNGGNLIYMTVNTCTDAEGSTPVEYRFNHIDGGATGSQDLSSGWQTGTYYNTGSNCHWNHQYQFQVEARDSLGNTTGLSAIKYTTTPDNDQTAPLPDPMVWHTVPYAVSDTEISMIVGEAVDGVATDGNGVDQGPSNPVSYSIKDVTNGVWLAYKVAANESIGSGKGLSFTHSGLTPGTQYTYYCTASDDADGGTNYQNNTTGQSPQESATTTNTQTNPWCIHLEPAVVHSSNDQCRIAGWKQQPVGTYVIAIPQTGALDDPPIGPNVLQPGSTGGVHGCCVSMWLKIKTGTWLDSCEIYAFMNQPSSLVSGRPLSLKTYNSNGLNGSNSGDKRFDVRIASQACQATPDPYAFIGFTNATNLSEDTWYLVTIDLVRPAGGSTTLMTPKIYINGVDDTGTYLRLGADFDEQWGIMELGASSYSGYGPFTSFTYNWHRLIAGNYTGQAFLPYKVDELTFWNDSLTPAQHLELYNGGSAMDISTHSYSSACTSWWRFDEGTGGAGTTTYNEITTGQHSDDMYLSNSYYRVPVWSSDVP